MSTQESHTDEPQVLVQRPKTRPMSEDVRARDAEPEPAPEVAAVWVPVSALRPWDSNPRLNATAIPKVAASIARFGFGSPILARKADGEIIAGHTRLAAAVSLGIDRVPVRYLDLDPANAHLLALADNKLGEEADWDNGKLLDILGELRQQSADVAAVAGWTDHDIDALLKSAGDAVLDAAPQAPPDEFKAYDENIETEHHCPKCGYEWSLPRQNRPTTCRRALKSTRSRATASKWRARSLAAAALATATNSLASTSFGPTSSYLQHKPPIAPTSPKRI